VLVSRLKALLEGHSAVNVVTLIRRYAFDTAIEIIYGAPVCPQPWTDTKASASVIAACGKMCKMAWGGSLLPWFGWLMSTRFMTKIIQRPTYDTQGNMIGLGALAALTRDMVTLHPEQAITSSQPSIVKNYLSVPEDNSSHMFPDEIWRESFNLIFAGQCSTAAALTAVLYRLGTPEGREWQSRIRDEHTPGLASSYIPPVLTAIIKETLRLHAPFPTAFPRVITLGAESAIPGLPAPLPVGTLVSAHTYILGHSKALWGEDVELWRPERWLEFKNESEKRELDEKFVAFSKGARSCVGKDIAMLTIARAVVSVLGTWEVRAVGELKGKSWLEMQYEECVLEFVKLAE
jgi:benzoate 4-monooxygenase